MRHVTGIACALSLMYCIACPAQAQAQAAASAPADASVASEENEQQTLVYAAARLADEGKPDEALECARQAIAGYEARYGASKQKVYASRTTVETLLYLAEAANAQRDAIVVESEYGYAYYFEGYALVELRRGDEAIASLQKAVALSPHNSQFLSELGNTYQSAKDWTNARTYYEKADAASEFSPDNVKAKEKSRAWRGLGFVSVELGKLDDAETLYKRCLELDSKDATARDELDYIRKLRATTAHGE